jgi:hypothetical protein
MRSFGLEMDRLLIKAYHAQLTQANSLSRILTITRTTAIVGTIKDPPYRVQIELRGARPPIRQGPSAGVEDRLGGFAFPADGGKLDYLG